ncbi:MAG: hypothetical protein Unbinned2026contig1000_20 [Prokaryotic dsDNA virus sp.]|nr:MAG: hypothetical protein Unbinned2026contig1000_20 [Prokaryotic dsDNA virus sp.]|tara:strand:- start:1118 stop:1453 length:336 start_codon:yes stop_codon:yes gene_type:complete
MQRDNTDKYYIKLKSDVKKRRELNNNHNKDDGFGLTDSQSDLLVFIRMFYKEYNLYPTIREMMIGEINGKPIIKKRKWSFPVSKMLLALELRGKIKRLSGQSRAMKLIDLD